MGDFEDRLKRGPRPEPQGTAGSADTTEVTKRAKELIFEFSKICEQRTKAASTLQNPHTPERMLSDNTAELCAQAIAATMLKRLVLVCFPKNFLDHERSADALIRLWQRQKAEDEQARKGGTQ